MTTKRQDEQSFKKLKAELKGLGYGFDFTSLEQLGNYYGGQGFYLNNDAIQEDNDKFDVWNDDRDALPGFNTDQTTYSCACPAIGGFDDPLPTAKQQRPMEILLEIFKLKHKKQGFAQAITLDKKEWGPLNKALERVGFKKVAEVPSRHGKYKNYVWNWVQG